MQAQLEGNQWGRPGPGGTYWRDSAVTGQNFFDKMVSSSNSSNEVKSCTHKLHTYEQSNPNATTTLHSNYGGSVVAGLTVLFLSNEGKTFEKETFDEMHPNAIYLTLWTLTHFRSKGKRVGSFFPTN